VGGARRGTTRGARRWCGWICSSPTIPHRRRCPSPQPLNSNTGCEGNVRCSSYSCSACARHPAQGHHTFTRVLTLRLTEGSGAARFMGRPWRPRSSSRTRMRDLPRVRCCGRAACSRFVPAECAQSLKAGKRIFNLLAAFLAGLGPILHLFRGLQVSRPS